MARRMIKRRNPFQRNYRNTTSYQLKQISSNEKQYSNWRNDIITKILKEHPEKNVTDIVKKIDYDYPLPVIYTTRYKEFDRNQTGPSLKKDKTLEMYNDRLKRQGYIK